MSGSALERDHDLDPAKFGDPDVTATGARRASVTLGGLDTLWFNTGTVCNLACTACYIESSPGNDRLAYITLAEVETYLEEIRRDAWPVREIGLTGGEPFMNPEIVAIMESCLRRGFEVLVLTNGMRPMMRFGEALLDLNRRLGRRLTMRLSLDHHTRTCHELERGAHSWEPAIDGLRWLSDNGFRVHVAGRTCWQEGEASLRAGYAALFADIGVAVDAGDPAALTLFPEMDERADVPEITEACWGILGVDPGTLMCAVSRMVVKRKNAAGPIVLPCTLLPYDPQFELGRSLGEAARTVKLNHPHCAAFCVLGGGSCSAAG